MTQPTFTTAQLAVIRRELENAHRGYQQMAEHYAEYARGSEGHRYFEQRAGECEFVLGLIEPVELVK